MTDQDYRRDLSRIESKLDRVETAIVSLARMEERMVALFNRMDRYDSDQKDTLKLVAELERVTIGRGQFFRWVDRGGAAMLGAVISAVVAYLFRGSV